ncbi:Glycoside hydrolase family 18 catalytic domain [Trinorchestia longiramus]|nr:Glycoside hydrolase family 18 catalytic domain [Trinorchestia longiramus]
METKLKIVSGPQPNTVEERGLVKETFKWKEVVENHGSYYSGKSVSNHTTLAYVTPWNNHGYDIAKLQSHRFALVSPVWLQIRRAQERGSASWTVAGLHDVDKGWMKEVKKNGGPAGTKIVPRLIFEGWSPVEYQALVDSKKLCQHLAADVIAVIKSQQLDGVVLEVWSQLPTFSLLSSMPSVLADLGSAIRDAGYIAVLVIPPPVYHKSVDGVLLCKAATRHDASSRGCYTTRHLLKRLLHDTAPPQEAATRHDASSRGYYTTRRLLKRLLHDTVAPDERLSNYDADLHEAAVRTIDSPGLFQRQHFEALAPHFDYFSLMTYDYSSFQNPGPNSPLPWMQKCVEMLVPDPSSSYRRKILLGLNLYGLDHSVTGGNHVLGSQVIQILSDHKPKIKYDDHSVEHFFEYKTQSGRRTVFYPSLHSVQQRMELATELGTGVSLWEIGQGLDYFYDLM